MKTEIISTNSINAIPRALEVLEAGGLVAFPTDTVYGVGALAFDGKAIESIYIAKDRPIEKAIPVLLGDTDDLDKVALEIPDLARRLASRFWPGPLTLVLPKKPALPEAVSATSTVGVRVPDHDVPRPAPRRRTDGGHLRQCFGEKEPIHGGRRSSRNWAGASN